MTPTQDEQVERLFHAAAALPPAEREAFLALTTGGDEAVRRGVERLLRGHERADGFLDAPVWEAAAAMLTAEPGEVMSGRRLNHYQLLSLLGKGGMGEVYLAEDTRLDRKVALKFLPADTLQDARRMGRFRREAKAASALNHPNILTIYEFGEAAAESGQVHFIASEFITGSTLRARLTEAPLPLAEALDIALQIAGALSAAHAAGIIHRDLKPENVMVRPDGLVKVLDFGLAKLTQRRPDVESERQGEAETGGDNESESVSVFSRNLPGSTSQTHPGLIVGTVGYMSPEQAQGQEVDARTDIFSFGVVLYEMLAGRQPFVGAGASDVVTEILRTEPPPLARFVPAVPHELERMVSRAMRKDLTDRYAAISGMLDDLRAVKQKLDNQTSLRKRRQLNLALVIVLFVLAAAAAYLIRSTRDGTGHEGDAPPNSIAVLPFINSGQDPNVEYLSNGVSESLINSLSQLPGVRVIARSSSFKYGSQNADLRKVAQALGATAIVTGSIDQSEDRLSVNVEMINTRDMTRMWGTQYQRNRAELPQVQTEIVGEIAATLHVSLTEGHRQQLTKNGGLNPQAYELVLKGRFLRSNGTKERRKKALECFQQALAIEPNYALAWAELGNLYSSLMNVGEMASPEAMAKARAAAERALALDGNLLEAHYTMANCKLDQWDWAGAAGEFQRILGLNPNSARTLSGYAYVLVYTGQFEPAIAAARRARDLDPVSLGTAVRLGHVLYLGRRYDEALEVLRKVLEMDQHYGSAYLHVGLASAALGRYSEAIDAYREISKSEGNPPYLQIYRGAAYAWAGARPRAEAIRTQLRTTKEYVSPAEMAILHIALGDREAALQALEQAYLAHDSQMQFLKVEPGYDALRSEPRFQELLRKTGLSQ